MNSLRYEKNLFFCYHSCYLADAATQHMSKKSSWPTFPQALRRWGEGVYLFSFRSIYGAHSSILSINTRNHVGTHAQRLPAKKSWENLGFLPSHICVISTRSPSCKVRPWGTDDPSNWLIAVEKQEIEKHKIRKFFIHKNKFKSFFLLHFFLWGTRLPLLSLSLPTGSSLSLPLFFFFMNGRARYTSTRDVTNGWGQSLYIQQPAIDGPPSTNAPNYN